MGIFDPYESPFMRDLNKAGRRGCLILLVTFGALVVYNLVFVSQPHHTTKKTVHKSTKTHKGVIPQTEEEK
jgi:hypothetical protein